MNLAICQDQKNLVSHWLLLLSSLSVSIELTQDFWEVCWARQVDLREDLPIAGKNILNTVDTRVACVTIQRETVQRLVGVHVGRHTSKAESREYFVRIIRFQNRSHLSDSSFVLVSRSHKMERTRLSGLTVGSCEINSDGERDLPPWSEIFDKAGTLFQLEGSEGNLTCSARVCSLKVDSFLCFKIIKSALGKSDLLVVWEDDDPKWNAFICAAKLSNISLLLRPMGALSVAGNLTFVDFRKVV